MHAVLEKPQQNSGLKIYSLDSFLQEPDPILALMQCCKILAPARNTKSITDVKTLAIQMIAELDQQIGDMLDAILHNKKFQQLEASWLGLRMLVNQAGHNRHVCIRVLDINWREVAKDLHKALEFDQSQLFHKIYSQEFGMPGGEPYGVLIGDYEVSHKPRPGMPCNDIDVLKALSQIAAASFAPFICAASPKLFGLDSFADLASHINLESIFQQQEYLGWNSLRKTQDSRFIGLTLPHTLMRHPYELNDDQRINYLEYTHQQEDYCWGNASFSFACVLIREFANVGWFSHIRGVPRDHLGGGLVTHINPQDFETEAKGINPKPVTNVIITDTLERQLSDLGFIALCQSYNTRYAAFHNNQSMQIPHKYDQDAASLNAKLSAMLQHILCASKIGHYIKIMIRDKVGSFLTAQECENFLQNWLHQYTSGSDSMDWHMQSRYPLREASVEVKPVPGKIDEFWTVIHLQPHYQMDQMTAELKLTTELNQINKAS